MHSMETQEEKEKKPISIILPGSRLNKKTPQRKLDYGVKLRALLDEYSTCLIVNVNNVGSKQIADMRKDFRGRARFLFGKNTMIRKILRDYMKESGKFHLMGLMESVRGNCGFVFTKENVADLRKEIVNRKKQCAAKVGAIAPVDVFIPAGPTGMEPTQTIMFQAMNIPTRINRGQIDIVDEVHLIHQGEKVGASQSALLSKLNIKPFYYGIHVERIYEDGKVYDANILDITTDFIAQSFYSGLRQVASFCFAIKYPTIVNVPHSLLNAYKRTLAFGLELNDYSWEALDGIKEILENPEAFAALSAAANKQGTDDKGKGGGKEEVKAKEKTPEPESSAAPVNPFGSDSSDDESSEDD